MSRRVSSGSSPSLGHDPNALPALDGDPYDWIRPGHYHSIISGDGRVHRLHDYNVDLSAHTYGRNRNSVALSFACMGGVPDPQLQLPVTAAGAGERIRSGWRG